MRKYATRRQIWAPPSVTPLDLPTPYDSTGIKCRILIFPLVPDKKQRIETLQADTAKQENSEAIVLKLV